MDLFCTEEFRGVEIQDLSVRSRFPAARKLTLDTQFDLATCEQIARAYLAATKNPAQSYTFTVAETLSLSDIVGAMKRVRVTHGSVQDYVAKITAIRTNWATGQTTVTVRGVAA